MYLPDSFVLMPHYRANLKAIRYESKSLNRIVADKLHSVTVAINCKDTDTPRFDDSNFIFDLFSETRAFNHLHI